ncbi:hypothetical protein M9H77_17661 [Catharanthus roseus]|uniref:Uncharacterized protein n=1 Tax=Catharanthus roseus TaxID=4058 RepID=A0ACC0B5K9_CATRO|nr:hypothetical protein M9H77_17661 [Catharanthus roseus]
MNLPNLTRKFSQDLNHLPGLLSSRKSSISWAFHIRILPLERQRVRNEEEEKKRSPREPLGRRGNVTESVTGNVTDDPNHLENYDANRFGSSATLPKLNGKVEARISMSGKKDKEIEVELNFPSFFAIEDEWKYNTYKQRQNDIGEAQHSSFERVIDTNLDSRADSLTRCRLDFQNLNNNGDNLLTEKETKLEDIILAPTHGENIIYEVHSRISSEVIPKVGMNFSNEEDAYEFYKAYTKEDGFGIQRSLSHKDNEGRILDRIFCCSSEGKRPSDKRDVISKTHRPKTRFGCKAMMKINCRLTGRYQVVQVIHEYNHISRLHYIRSKRSWHLKHNEEGEIKPFQDQGIEYLEDLCLS